MIYSENYVPIGHNLWKLKVQLDTSDDYEQKRKKLLWVRLGVLVYVENKQINHS